MNRKPDRNLRVLQLRIAGIKAEDIAKVTFVTKQRVDQIVMRTAKELLPDIERVQYLTPKEICKEYGEEIKKRIKIKE